MTWPLTYLIASARHARLEVRLNDVPLMRLYPSHASQGMAPLVYYAVRGANEVAARLVPETTEEARREAAGRVRIATFNEGELVTETDGETIVELALSAVDPTPPPRGFALDQAQPQWAWSRCDPLQTDADTLAEASGFANRMLDAWSRCDPEPILAASAWKLDDVTVAFPNRSPDEVRRLTAESIARTPPAPPWLRPFALEICARGRLIDCLAADAWPYVAKVGPSGQPLYFPMLIGRAAGAWRIVR